MGQLHNVTLSETAKSNNIQLTGVDHRPCTHCAEAKIRMKKMPKDPAANLFFHGHTFGRPKMNRYQLLTTFKEGIALSWKLQNRGIPGNYWGPSEYYNGDTYTIWNPITKHVIESQSAIFLQQTYADFHKIDKLQAAKQFAIFTDELNEMLDEDEDVTPVDDAGNNLPNEMNNDSDISTKLFQWWCRGFSRGIQAWRFEHTRGNIQTSSGRPSFWRRITYVRKHAWWDKQCHLTGHTFIAYIRQRSSRCLMLQMLKTRM
jgi:hypothetical protein